MGLVVPRNSPAGRNALRRNHARRTCCLNSLVKTPRTRRQWTDRVGFRRGCCYSFTAYLLVEGIKSRAPAPPGQCRRGDRGGGGGGREPLQAGSPQPTQGRGQVAGRQRSESRPAPSPAQVAPPWGLGSLQPALPFQPAGSLSAVLMVDFAAFLRSAHQTCRVWSSPHTPTTHWERWRWAARRPRPRCVGVRGTSAPCLKRGGRHGRTRGRRPSPPRARDLDGDGRGGVCVWGVHHGVPPQPRPGSDAAACRDTSDGKSEVPAPGPRVVPRGQSRGSTTHTPTETPPAHARCTRPPPPVSGLADAPGLEARTRNTAPSHRSARRPACAGDCGGAASRGPGHILTILWFASAPSTGYSDLPRRQLDVIA